MTNLNVSDLYLAIAQSEEFTKGTRIHVFFWLSAMMFIGNNGNRRLGPEGSGFVICTPTEIMNDLNINRNEYEDAISFLQEHKILQATPYEEDYFIWNLQSEMLWQMKELGENIHSQAEIESKPIEVTISGEGSLENFREEVRQQNKNKP